MITRKELHPDLVAELEHLKKLHDYDYAKQCVLDKLNEEYNSMINTDIWYKAAKKYLNNKINIYELDSLIYNFKFKNTLLDNINLIELGYDNTHNCISFSDIEFNIIDGADEKKHISIKDLHNVYPDVELEDNFKQFCVEYKRSNEERNKGSI